MKRQQVRKLLTLAFFLLFPVIIYYFSPILILNGALLGVVVGCAVTFVALFVFSLFFGRAFCGWVCPVGGLQECLASAQNKKAKGGKRNLIKYFIWVPWLCAIAVFFARAGGFLGFDFFFETTYGISVVEPASYVVYYGVVILVVVMSLTAGRRAFCHYLCWIAPFMVVGTKISNALRLPSLRIKADKEKCVGCKLCSAKCPMSLEVEKMVADGRLNNSECILCGECVDACPKKALMYTVKREQKAE